MSWDMVIPEGGGHGDDNDGKLTSGVDYMRTMRRSLQGDRSQNSRRKMSIGRCCDALGDRGDPTTIWKPGQSLLG